MSIAQETNSIEFVCLQAAKLLLASMSKTVGDDGQRLSFLFGTPRTPWMKTMGAEVFLSRSMIIKTALFVRDHGPDHLRLMAVDGVRAMLSTFVMENYWCLAEEIMFANVTGPFTLHISPETTLKLAKALKKSTIFAPENELTLYPLTPVTVAADFESEQFCFLKPSALTHDRLGVHPSNRLFPDKFSPFDQAGKKEEVTSWLGVIAPNFAIAEKRKAIILGALALTLPRAYRKMFSMRHNYGGRCTISRTGSTESLGKPSVPSLMENAIVELQDHPWMEALSKKIGSSEQVDNKHCRALEYFYRAWPLPPNESFSHLFMALDSIFGDASQATQSIIEAITKFGASSLPYERLRLLLSLRNTVVHGGAPDVHDSRKYHRYYETYGDDPISDIELITAHCFRSVIFDGQLNEHLVEHQHR